MQHVTAAILAKLCADFVLELMSMCAPTKIWGFQAYIKSWHILGEACVRYE